MNLLIKQSYNLRLIPNSEQEQFFQGFTAACSFIWNKALTLQKEKLKTAKKRYSFDELHQLLTKWKDEKKLQWLNYISKDTLEDQLKLLDQTYNEAWKRAKQNKPICYHVKIKGNKNREATFDEKFGFPLFKKKGKNHSFTESYENAFIIDDNKINFSKIGHVKFYKSKGIEGNHKNVTVFKKNNKWFAQVHVEEEINHPFAVKNNKNKFFFQFFLTSDIKRSINPISPEIFDNDKIAAYDVQNYIKKSRITSRMQM